MLYLILSQIIIKMKIILPCLGHAKYRMNRIEKNQFNNYI
jgi:hypothetical protein